MNSNVGQRVNNAYTIPAQRVNSYQNYGRNIGYETQPLVSGYSNQSGCGCSRTNFQGVMTNRR